MMKTILTFLVFCLSQHYSYAAAFKGYQAVEIGNNILLNTPWGSRVFFGDLGLKDLKNYKFSLSLEDLRNKMAEEAAGGQGGTGRDHEEKSNDADLSSDENNLIVIANELYNKGKFSEALKYVEEILRRNKQNVRALIMKGSLLHLSGEKEAAKKSWEEARKIQPNNTELKSILENYQ